MQQKLNQNDKLLLQILWNYVIKYFQSNRFFLFKTSKWNKQRQARTRIVIMSNSFTAIDFETAHGKRWSICQVGLVRVENEIVKEQISVLVQPPNNFYWDRFIDIHGITPEQTATAKTFDKVWQQIKPFIKNQNLVAHNGFSFDFHCLNQTLEYYDIVLPKYEGYCTYRIFGDNLASLCKEYKIPLNHHDALSDAMACAKLFQIHLDNSN